ncbi:MAG TPA: DUF748 domain-containing protein [Gemmatimonadales bacterium]
MPEGRGAFRLPGITPRGRFWLILVAGILVVYTLAGFFLVPWILHRQLRTQARVYLHREATLAKARFNPFTLKTTLIGYDLRDLDGSRLLAFDTMVVNLSSASIIRRALVLDEFRLVRPQIVGRLGADGRPSISDLFAKKPDSAAAAQIAPTKPPRLVVHHTRISQGEIVFIDHSREPTYEEDFSDLGVQIEELSTLPNKEGEHLITVSFASGAEVNWTGKMQFQPLRLEGRFILSKLQFPRLAEAFGGRFPLRLTKGDGGATLLYLVQQDSAGPLRATIQDASLNLHDLALQPRTVAEDWLKVGSVDITGVKVQWPERTVGISLVKVSTPWVTAERTKNKTLNWAPILDAMQKKDTVKTDSGQPWKVVCDAVEVVDGGIRLADHSVTPKMEFEVSKISLELKPVSSDPTVKTDVALTALGSRGTEFNTKGTYTQKPFAADLDLAIRRLPLPVGQPYLGPDAPAVIESGKASINGKVRMREGKPSVVFDGIGTINDLRIKDPAGDSLLTWTGMTARGIHLTSTPDLLRIKSIKLEQPFARVAISKERELNLSKLSAMIPVDTTKPAYPYEIGEVLFDDAQIDFSDESLILPFRTRIDSTHGAIRDVASFGGTPGSLELEGKVGQYGLARASGTLMIADPFAATTIKADFRNVDMVQLTPYSAQFAGYAIKDGKLDLDLNYRIQNRQLQADHHIVADDLQLGDKVEGGESPGFLVKLAISLMKDKEGKIKLDVPVEGTVDDPEFSYKGIVWKAIKGILGKIATAPFRFLGKLLGIGGGDDAELVDFDPGRADIIPPEKEKLDSLTAELGRKPELTISIEGRYDSISDVAELKEAKLKAMIAAGRDTTGKHTKDDTSSTYLSKTLETLYVAKFSKASFDSLKTSFIVPRDQDPAAAPSAPSGDEDKDKQAPPKLTGKPGSLDAPAFYMEVRSRLLALQTVTPDELKQLAKDRANAIAAALTASGTVDSTRVTVADPAPVKKKKQGSSRVPSEMAMDAK